MTEEQQPDVQLDSVPEDALASMTPEEAELAKDIAEKLNETLPVPILQINRIVQICGVDFALQVMRDTLEVEANGGMKTHNGMRLRTIGGVYFFIARGKMAPEQRVMIFPSQDDKIARAQAKLPPFIWEQRGEIIKGIKRRGRLQDVRIKLIGRPGEWHKRQDVVILQMKHQGPYPSFPTGLPPMPSQPTEYTVYVGFKQWSRVERDLRGTKLLLEIDGICAYDPELQGVAVYTTTIKTRKPKDSDEEAGAASNGQHSEPAAPAAKPKEAPPRPAKKPAAAAAPVVPQPEPVPVIIPPHAPPAVQQKLQELYTAVNQFRQRIAALESKPADQRTGLEMTRKLLTSTEQQINVILQRYSS